jgi:hypothetical protein
VTHASVQNVSLRIETIHDNVVQLTDGEHRAVLEVSGTSSPIEDDARHEAVLAGFAAFLNALSFPVQVVVRSVPVDLARYVAALEERARVGLPGQLASLAQDHAAFVQTLARQRMLLERRFYVVVPAEAPPRSGWQQWRRRRETDEADAAWDAARRQLTFRCDDVARQLSRCGLHVRRLADLELAQLYLACWSPERARAQRFRQRLDDFSTLAVRATRAAGEVPSAC